MSAYAERIEFILRAMRDVPEMGGKLQWDEIARAADRACLSLFFSEVDCRAQAWRSPMIAEVERATGVGTKTIQAILLAYHRSRTPSPEEVEAVAEAWLPYTIIERGGTEWFIDCDALPAGEFVAGPFKDYEDAERAFDLMQARAALAASDAWRVRELEKLNEERP